MQSPVGIYNETERLSTQSSTKEIKHINSNLPIPYKNYKAKKVEISINDCINEQGKNLTMKRNASSIYGMKEMNTTRTHSRKRTVFKLEDCGNSWTEGSPLGSDDSSPNMEMGILKQIEEKLMNEKNNKQIIELIKRCPYIERLRKTSEKYRSVISMLETLENYNEIINRVLKQGIHVETKEMLSSYNDFLKRNRGLRIEIKCLLGEEDENQKKIDEMKIGRASCRERVYVLV